MLGENSIKARLCGGSLMSTIEQFDPGFTNASDQVTIQKHIAGVSIRNHLSIVQLEVNTSGDGFVHFAFDDSHGKVKRKDREEVGRSLPLMWPIYGSQEPSTRGLVPLSRLSHSPAGRDSILQPHQLAPHQYNR